MSSQAGASTAGSHETRVRDTSRDHTVLSGRHPATETAGGGRRAGAARAAGVAVFACLVLVVLAGCGGGSGKTTSSGGAPATAVASTTTAATTTAGGGVLPGGVVARVGGHVITQALLNAWMTERVGEDFFLLKRVRATPGLASEPANYPGCVAAAKAAASKTGAPPSTLSAGQLTVKCEELYRDVRGQALGYLVSSYWSEGFDGKYGLRVSEAEVRHALSAMRAEQYPHAGELERVIGERSRTLAQELFTIKNDLLQAKLRRLLTTGGPKRVKAFIAAARRVTDIAECNPEYIVEHCKGYKQPKEQFASSTASSPAQLLTEITQ
jgi:hypothetical protein